MNRRLKGVCTECGSFRVLWYSWANPQTPKCLKCIGIKIPDSTVKAA